MATLKPTTPLRAPNKGPLKPASPLHPKNAPKTPISHPQRRWRFQSRLGRHPQRRQWFQSQTSTSEQRRWRFQTTGPAGLQGLAAVPVAGGSAWPGDQCAADVTNVVKPARFKSPHEAHCYKRRQSGPKYRHFQRKSPQIDDVCNNTHQSTPKTLRTRRDSMATLKPTTPLRAPNKGLLKPTSPLHPKTAPKNTHFAPAKAMAVSVEARPAPAKATVVSIPDEHERAKAMAVSDNRPSWPTGPGCDTRT